MTYLHGLNRRLQEESESLTGHVGLLLKENLALAEANAALQEAMEHLRQQTFTGGAGSRRSSAGRHWSDIGSTLGEVKEDAGGGEKMEMETELDAFRAELNDCRREETGPLPHSRLSEVEHGVESIIQDLETKVVCADQKHPYNVH